MSEKIIGDYSGIIFQLHYFIDQGDKDGFTSYLLSHRGEIHSHCLDNTYVQQLYILVLERGIDLLI